MWIGRRGGGPVRGINVTTVISRVDPRSLKVTANVRLPRRSSVYGPGPSEGYPRLAVGAGAVWAIGVDNRIHRIDPATGKIEARIPIAQRLGGIAAGPEGVWFVELTDVAVARIDPATNRVSDRIPVDSGWLSGIAVGGGAVWATSPQDGRLWRIEPGPRPRLHAVKVGGWLSFLGYGAGAAWVAEYLGGVVTRVDARTNAVAARDTVGAVQALAASGGTAWVSVAGVTGKDALPASACGPVESGGQTPDLLITSSFPLARRRGRGACARIGRRDPMGADGARFPRRTLRRGLPVVRRLDGADQRLRDPALRLQRQRVRATLARSWP